MDIEGGKTEFVICIVNRDFRANVLCQVGVFRHCKWSQGNGNQERIENQHFEWRRTLDGRSLLLVLLLAREYDGMCVWQERQHAAQATSREREREKRISHQRFFSQKLSSHKISRFILIYNKINNWKPVNYWTDTNQFTSFNFLSVTGRKEKSTAYFFPYGFKIPGLYSYSFTSG